MDSSSVEEGNPDMQRTLIVFVTAIAAGCVANSPPQSVESSNTEILKSAPDKEHKTDSLELYNASVPEKERIICRNEPITGTHMYRKSCYTVAHKDAMESHSKDWLRTRGTSGSAQKVVDPEDPRLGK